MTAQSEGLNGGTSIRHFNTNNKKIFCNSKFYQEGNKNGSKQGNVILLSISRSFRPLSDDFRSFRKISEDVRKLLKFSKKKFRQMLLDGTTLDCFERSRMTLLLCLTAESSPLLQKLTRTLTTPEENPLDAAFGLDADQRIVGS